MHAADATDICPISPLGVSERPAPDDPSDTQYLSTAATRPVDAAEEFIETAVQDSFMQARVYLRKDSRVPKTKIETLAGVVNLGSCSANGRVYATVMVSKKNTERAIKLREQMQRY